MNNQMASYSRNNLSEHPGLVIKEYMSYLSLKFPNIQPNLLRDMPKGECHVKVKFKGELSFIKYTNGKISLFTKSGQVQHQQPFMTDLKDIFGFWEFRDISVLGYLSFSNLKDSSSCDSFMNTSDSKKATLFVPWDILQLDGKKLRFSDAQDKLSELFDGTVFQNESAVLPTNYQVARYYDRWVNSNDAEGLFVYKNNFWAFIS